MIDINKKEPRPSRRKTWTTKQELPEFSNKTLRERASLIRLDLRELKEVGLRNYGSSCTRCGIRYNKGQNIYLKFHHRKSVQKWAADQNLDLNKANAKSNLAVLCESCHVEWHAHYENKYEITFDEWKKLPSLYDMRDTYFRENYDPLVKFTPIGPRVTLKEKPKLLDKESLSLKSAFRAISQDLHYLARVIRSKVNGRVKKLWPNG